MKCKLCNLFIIDSTSLYAPFCSSHCQMSYKTLQDEFKKVKIEHKPIKKDKDYGVPVKRPHKYLHRRKT